MTEAIVKAREFSEEHHYGQTDKVGKPYIEHPVRVAQSITHLPMNSKPMKELAVVVAYLHDIVEDTFITLDVIEENFGIDVAYAVDCITHRENEPNVDYIERVMLSEVARVVKIADIMDNLTPTRFEGLDEATKTRLWGKYSRALFTLMN